MVHPCLPSFCVAILVFMSCLCQVVTATHGFYTCLGWVDTLWVLNKIKQVWFINTHPSRVAYYNCRQVLEVQQSQSTCYRPWSKLDHDGLMDPLIMEGYRTPLLPLVVWRQCQPFYHLPQPSQKTIYSWPLQHCQIFPQPKSQECCACEKKKSVNLRIWA